MRWTLCFALMLPLFACGVVEEPDPFDIDFAPRPASGSGLFGTAYYVGDTAPFTRGPRQQVELEVLAAEPDDDDDGPHAADAADRQGFFYFDLEPGAYRLCDVSSTVPNCIRLEVEADAWVRADPVSTNIGVSWDYGQCTGIACGD